CLDDGDPSDDNIEDTDEKADGTAPAITNDQLNGMWVTTLGDAKQDADTVIESWTAIGIRLHLGDKVVSLTRTGDALKGTGVALTVHPNKAGITDDSIDGTVNGQTVLYKRDTAVKPPIVMSFPGDRPYRSWLTDTIMPLAQQDRESFKHLTTSAMFS